jgi:anti-sigma factor RsiW
MSESCREWRGDLAAAALGRLEDDARVALQAHLDGCAACRAELADITPVAAALPAADPAYVTTRSPSTAPPPGLAERVLGRLAFARADERRRGRRRVAVVVGTAAAAVAAAIGLLALGASLDSSTAPARHVAFGTAPVGVDASADLRSEDYGTEVKLDVTGLDDGEWYWLWLTGTDGRRVNAGTFRASGDHFSTDMTSALPLSKARRIWVTDDANNVVLDARIAPRGSSQS